MPAVGRGTGRASMLYAFRRNLRGAEGACGSSGIPGIDQAPAPMSDAGPDEGPGRVVDREEAAQGATFVRDACVDAVVVPTFVDLADAAGRLADFVAPNPRSVHALPDGRGPFDAWGATGTCFVFTAMPAASDAVGVTTPVISWPTASTTIRLVFFSPGTRRTSCVASAPVKVC